MQSRDGTRARRAAMLDPRRWSPVVALLAACALSACSSDSGPLMASANTGVRGGTIAFESIDGPPQAVFSRLVASLAAEADARQVAVVSREGVAAYRVRGYLAVHVERGRTGFAYVWDVYDAAKNRALRISGEEPGRPARKPAEAWASADDAVIGRIAKASMDQLVAFLAAPGSPPPAGPTGPAVAELPAPRVAFAGE